MSETQSQPAAAGQASGGRKNLWAPWRMSYLQQLGVDAPPSAGDCFLCAAARRGVASAEAGVLHRTARATLLMNRYPYTNGHLLVAPHAHVPDLFDLEPADRAELMELADLGCRALRRSLNCQGFNVGANLGAAAGAGVPGHLHLHVVPRWLGDTAFMDVIGDVRVIPQAMEHATAMIAAAVKSELA